MTTFKPMLAGAFKDENLINFPVIMSPKLDGIRVLISPDHGPVTRSLKHVPNYHIFRELNRESLWGLDGEIIVGGVAAGDAFNSTQSGVMRTLGEPDYTYAVFDSFLDPTAPYTERMATAKAIVDADTSGRLLFVESPVANNFSDLQDFELKCLDDGYEGIMFRNPKGPYKFGRSTERSNTLVKVKQFSDAEARVVGIEFLNRNHNEAKTNALGRTERSSHKDGKVADYAQIGALMVEGIGAYEGVKFGIGTGFSEAVRREIADMGTDVLDRVVNYRYQAEGAKDAPRFPVFHGFRDEDDMS